MAKQPIASEPSQRLYDAVLQQPRGPERYRKRLDGRLPDGRRFEVLSQASGSLETRVLPETPDQFGFHATESGLSGLTGKPGSFALLVRNPEKPSPPPVDDPRVNLPDFLPIYPDNHAVTRSIDVPKLYRQTQELILEALVKK